MTEDESLSLTLAEIDARLIALEAKLDPGQAEPFIGSDLRPELVGGTDYSGQGDLQARMAAGDRDAKTSFDTLP